MSSLISPGERCAPPQPATPQITPSSERQTPCRHSSEKQKSTASAHTACTTSGTDAASASPRVCICASVCVCVRIFIAVLSYLAVQGRRRVPDMSVSFLPFSLLIFIANRPGPKQVRFIFSILRLCSHEPAGSQTCPFQFIHFPCLLKWKPAWSSTPEVADTTTHWDPHPQSRRQN